MLYSLCVVRAKLIVFKHFFDYQKKNLEINYFSQAMYNIYF